MQAGKASKAAAFLCPQESDESRATTLDLGSDIRFYMADTAFLEEEDASVVTSSCHFALAEPTAGTELFDESANAVQVLDVSWESMSNMDDIFGSEETVYWLEEDPAKEDECDQKSEDFESYLISTASPEQELPGPEVTNDVPSSHSGMENSKQEVDGCLENLIAEESRDIEGTSAEEACQAATVTDTEGGGEEEASLDATVVHQLSRVVSNLDNSTRLCIQKALYRLAESAARRHGLDEIAEMTNFATKQLSNTPSRFGETGTNSIDRTIASLLFHIQSPGGPPTTQGPISGCASPESAVTSSREPAENLGNAADKVAEFQCPASKLTSKCFMNVPVVGNKIPLPPIHKHRCAANLQAMVTKKLPDFTSQPVLSDSSDKRRRAISNGNIRKRVKHPGRCDL